MKNSIDKVPDEILIEIFIYLTESLKTIMITLPSVCRRFYKLIDPPKELSDQSKKEDQLDQCMKKLNINDDEGDLMNDVLYEYLLRSYSLNQSNVNSEILKRYKTFRIAFLQNGWKGLALPLEKCFKRELCYKGVTIFENENSYLNNPSLNIDIESLFNDGTETVNDKPVVSDDVGHGCVCGRTVRMNEDFRSSNAGMCIVNNPILYDTGVHYFEFRVHKAGTYDNLLLGIVLIDLLKDECKVENPMEFTSLSERFEVKTKSLDVPFLDYVGSGNSLGFGYYDEGFHVYHKNTSIKTYDFGMNQNTFTYPCDTKNCVYVIGVYFDSKNLRLAFSKNGTFTKEQLDISELIHTKYADYLSGNLAFNPAMSMGQLNDAITFESRIPYEKIQQLRTIFTELSFLPYNTD